MNKAAHELNLQAQELINAAMCELGRSLSRTDAIWIMRKAEQGKRNATAKERYYKKRKRHHYGRRSDD